MRAPEKRVFKLDIGNIPPAEVDNYMQQVINKMKKAPVIDEKTGEYNLRYNIQNLTDINTAKAMKGGTVTFKGFTSTGLSKTKASGFNVDNNNNMYNSK